MNNNISDVNIKLQFNYKNFHEQITYAIADSITVNGRNIAKNLPIVDRLETELLEKDFEIEYLKKQIEFLEGNNANNG